MNIGNAAKAILVEKGMSQSELAGNMKRSLTQTNKILNNRTKLGEDIDELARGLGVTLLDLMTRAGKLNEVKE